MSTQDKIIFWVGAVLTLVCFCALLLTVFIYRWFG